MKCPVCKISMVILELKEVEVDYCIECKGVWLDEGELELLLNNKENVLKYLNSLNKFNNVKEDEYICPRCKDKMLKVKFDESEVVIDKCKNNHGLWFDKNELKDLLNSDKFDNENEIKKLLSEIFK